MGRLVDAGALLKAIGNHGSDMIVPNVYLATGKVHLLIWPVIL